MTLPADPRDYDHSDKWRESHILMRQGRKRCWGCLRILPMSAFYRHGVYRPSRCKPCLSEKSKRAYHKAVVKRVMARHTQ